MDRRGYGPSQPSRGRTVWRAVWLGLFALVVLFHLLGGWYYAGVLEADALEVRASEPAQDVRVVAVSADALTLEAVDGEDAELTRDGVFGFRHPHGYVHLTDVVSMSGSGAVRRFVTLSGEAPRQGDVGDVEAYAFPDPAAAGVEVTATTYDTPLGPMGAWEIDGSRSDWVIHVHGKGAPQAEALRLVRALAGEGYHQMVITYRNDPGQPADPSGYYQFGRTEWEDLAGAVEYARENGAGRVALVGYSTGGGVVLSYLYKAKQDVVTAAILDSPNIDVSATIDHNAASREMAFGIPIPVTLTATAKFIAGLRYGINWQAIDYVRRAGQLVVPTLVIHGTEDATAPIAISRRLAEMRDQMVQLVEIPGAGHVQGWNVDTATYERRIVDFLSDTTF